MELLVGALLGLLLAIAAAFFLLPRIRALVKDQFSALAREALKDNNEQFLALAKERLAKEQAQGVSELDQKRQKIESAIDTLNKQLESYENLVRAFEKDREEKYGNLSGRLETAATETEKLRQVTERLNNILGNVKLRGQWGERIAEDILRFCGLQEGVHYLRNKAQDASPTRPDYIFLLPDQRKVYMDVKFPFDKYLQFVNATDGEDKKSLQEAFIKAVKERIRELQKRDYINPEEQTLDFVLLFFPNEQAYGFAHEASPGLMDEALKQRIILCSPFTLYAVLSVIRQAHDNFYFAQAIRDIVTKINGFMQAYGVFKERFGDLGKRLDKVSEKYTEITATSYRMLESKIRQIEEYRKGQKIPEALPESEEEIQNLLT